MIALLVTLAVSVPAATSIERTPRIHTPKGYGGEFAFVDVYIANSKRDTRVLICVSGRCRDGQRLARSQWTGYAGRVRRGATRTVRVMASNDSRGSQWGDAPVKFR